MLLSVLKFKSPCVLGSTPSDLQDRGIPLPQACKEVRRHGFPTPLLPSSPNYCPKHKTHDLLVSKKALEDSRAGGRRIFRPDATSVAPMWQCYYSPTSTAGKISLIRLFVFNTNSYL